MNLIKPIEPRDLIVAKLEEYLAVPSVVGHEQPFVKHLAQDFAKDAKVLELENLLVINPTKKPSSIITAHLDRHGLVSTFDGNAEYAAFNEKKKRGMEITEAAGVFMRIPGRFLEHKVLAYDDTGKILGKAQVHRTSDFNYDLKRISFEIKGLKLPPGTPLAYHSYLSKNDGFLSSQIDNCASIAVVRQMVKEGYDGLILLPKHEEIGLSWKHIAEYLDSNSISSKKVITLDTTPYNELPEKTSEWALIHGNVALRNKDKNGVFNKEFVAQLKSACKSMNIPYDVKDELIEQENVNLTEKKGLGSTELGRVVAQTKGRINGATVQLPTLHYHTNDETTTYAALGNQHKLLSKVLQ